MEKRLLNLDFLRGIFVFLALQEHYFHYLNSTFMYFYDNYGLAETIKSYYQSYEGHLIPLTTVQIKALFIFVPWVSHGYIALAAFNLAKRTSSDLKVVLPSKLKLFLAIGLFFVLESFIVSTDFGEAITVHPLLIWMILLSVIAVIYSYFDIVGIILFYFISFAITFMIKDLHLSTIFEGFIQGLLHKDFAYDARIESFLITSITGFMMGYIYYHLKQYRLKLLAGFTAIQLAMAFIVGFTIFQIDPINMENTFRSETVYYSQLGNLFFIQFILCFFVSFMLMLEEYNIQIKNRFLYFISINSLFVFAVHKIFFTKLVIPLRLYFGYLLGVPYTNTYTDGFLYVVLTVAFVWLIKKIKLVEILTRSES